MADPRTGEILKTSIVVADSWQRGWLTELAVNDPSNGNSAVLRDIGSGAPIASSKDRTRTSKEASLKEVSLDNHQRQHANGHVHGPARSLQGHAPGMCSHAMAHRNKHSVSLLRLMLETGGTDVSTRKVGGRLLKQGPELVGWFK